MRGKDLGSSKRRKEKNFKKQRTRPEMIFKNAPENSGKEGRLKRTGRAHESSERGETIVGCRKDKGLARC